MTSIANLRQQFLDYFQQKGHSIVPSASLIPANDPTLLFTNAGMVQFKDTFLGQDPRSYTTAASSQRCVRAGGKHNDLENVGYTARHHTFFEMLGNFSFGDYFKTAAIEYAWEFLTQIMQLPPEKLWITVYEQDNEAADIWLKQIGIDPARFARIGAKDNFWQMGDTGPCGPCSEIFYDHGPTVAGGPPGSAKAEGDRYVEIWNLVFMQYNRAADGNLTLLPKPSVDTGMGLERLAAVMQGVTSNYAIDLFQQLIAAAAQVTGTATNDSTALKVIADHIRSCAFLLTDGVIPANEGRGYVLRRIIRRAVRYGHKLGCKEPFFYRLVAPLANLMGAAYPELVAAQKRVATALQQEEERFAQTLEQGMQILEKELAGLSGTVLPGELAFKLYDTYGFPLDITQDIARERNLSVDQAAFNAAMQQQRERARASNQFVVDLSQTAVLDNVTQFTGYDELVTSTRITQLLQEQQPVSTLNLGESGVLVLAASPFYAESGGQVGDQGEISSDNNRFIVKDTRKSRSAILHFGEVVAGSFTLDMPVIATVKTQERRQIARNHSATHLLHAALRDVLGVHVQQKGSLVDAQRLRFDFSHHQAVTADELQAIQDLVNQQILTNQAASVEEMSMDAAKQRGAMALFGEKYGEQVRVVSLGDFSVELCGGTHVKRAGDIGLFHIITESGVAAGIRRIEAITGTVALDWVRHTEARLRQLGQMLKTTPDQLEQKIQQLLERQQGLQKQLTELQQQLVKQSSQNVQEQVHEVNGIKILTHTFATTDNKILREALDRYKQQLGSAIIVLAGIADEQVKLIAGVSKDLTSQFKAGDLVNFIAEQVGGRGGGRPDMAQAGGNKPDAVPNALASVLDWVKQRVIN